MMDSQNINSFISNFNYASTPDNLGQIFYNEQSSIEQRSFTSAADPVNMQSNRLAGLPGWTMKGKGLDSPRWLSSVSITAIIDLLLKSYPNFSLKSVHNALSLRGVHFVSKSKALEHVLANGGLQEEVNHSSFLCLLCFFVCFADCKRRSTISLCLLSQSYLFAVLWSSLHFFQAIFSNITAAHLIFWFWFSDLKSPWSMVKIYTLWIIVLKYCV